MYKLGYTYTGTLDKAGIFPCQKWTDDSPNYIDESVLKFPDETAEEANNYCRNPDETDAPWCYVLDKYVAWNYCNIRKCTRKYTHTQVK